MCAIAALVTLFGLSFRALADDFDLTADPVPTYSAHQEAAYTADYVNELQSKYPNLTQILSAARLKDIPIGKTRVVACSSPNVIPMVPYQGNTARGARDAQGRLYNYGDGITERGSRKLQSDRRATDGTDAQGHRLKQIYPSFDAGLKMFSHYKRDKNKNFLLDGNGQKIAVYQTDGFAPGNDDPIHKPALAVIVPVDPLQKQTVIFRKSQDGYVLIFGDAYQVHRVRDCRNPVPQGIAWQVMTREFTCADEEVYIAPIIEHETKEVQKESVPVTVNVTVNGGGNCCTAAAPVYMVQAQTVDHYQVSANYNGTFGTGAAFGLSYVPSVGNSSTTFNLSNGSSSTAGGGSSTNTNANTSANAITAALANTSSNGISNSVSNSSSNGNNANGGQGGLGGGSGSTITSGGDKPTLPPATSTTSPISTPPNNPGHYNGLPQGNRSAQRFRGR
jgi:hypothetical protein